jgi:hypothetical protein
VGVSVTGGVSVGVGVGVAVGGSGVMVKVGKAVRVGGIYFLATGVFVTQANIAIPINVMITRWVANQAKQL